MPSIRFHTADIKFIPLSNRKSLKVFINQMFLMEGGQLREMNYIFCSDNYLLDINRKYLNHDYLTDIITFDLSEDAFTIGEIYISLDRVRENARLISTTLQHELLRVIFHGALHLLGYRDKTKREITFMRQKEEFYLHKFLKFP